MVSIELEIYAESKAHGTVAITVLAAEPSGDNPSLLSAIGYQDQHNSLPSQKNHGLSRMAGADPMQTLDKHRCLLLSFAGT